MKSLQTSKRVNKEKESRNMIIGIDHGYGFTKTSNSIFASGVAKFKEQPPVTANIVQYNNMYYQIGVAPDGLTTDKTANEDYYILTLAAIAEELKRCNIVSAHIILAVGIPLTRYGAEKEDFINYLSRNDTVSFGYEDKQYTIRIDPQIYVYPQGYAAIAPQLNTIKGTCYLADIGTGTTEILPISGDHKIDLKRAYTIQWGVSNCISMINEEMSREYQCELSTDQIIDIMLDRDIVIAEPVKKLVVEQIREWCAATFVLFHTKKVNYEITQTFCFGGGSGLLKRFSDEQPDMITYIDDIKANAKGYELLTKAIISKK